jgi:hypothetical protein
MQFNLTPRRVLAAIGIALLLGLRFSTACFVASGLMPSRSVLPFSHSH